MDNLTTIIASLIILVIGNVLFILVTKRPQLKEDHAIQTIKDELKIIDPSGQMAFLIDWKKKKPRKSTFQLNVVFTGLMLFLLLGAYNDPMFPIGCALMMCVAPLLFFFLHYAHNIVIIRPDRIEGMHVNRRKEPKVIDWVNIERISYAAGELPSLIVEGGGSRISIPSFYVDYDRFVSLLSRKFPDKMMSNGMMVIKEPILPE
jgi:hypothetical protein